MRTTLSILDSSGDLTLTWDHTDPAAQAKARAEVERLRDSGYTFFLTDGSPADEITAGQGTLVVCRLEPAEVLDPPAPAGHVHSRECYDDAGPGRGGVSLICDRREGDPETPANPGPGSEDAEPPKRRRGRPPKADRQVVAVRPLRGG